MSLQVHYYGLTNVLCYYLLQQYVANKAQDDYDNHLFYKKRKEIKKLKIT